MPTVSLDFLGMCPTRLGGRDPQANTVKGLQKLLKKG